jgi:hypothetical protein
MEVSLAFITCPPIKGRQNYDGYARVALASDLLVLGGQSLVEEPFWRRRALRRQTVEDLGRFFGRELAALVDPDDEGLLHWQGQTGAPVLARWRKIELRAPYRLGAPAWRELVETLDGTVIGR